MGRLPALGLEPLEEAQWMDFPQVFRHCPKIHADGPRLSFRHQHGGEGIAFPDDGLVDIAQVVLLQEIRSRRTDQGRLPRIRGVDHHHRHVGLVEDDGVALDELHVPQIEPGACGQVIPLPHDRCLVVVLRVDGTRPAAGQDDRRRSNVSLAPAEIHTPDAHDALRTPQQRLHVNAPLRSDPVAPGDQRGDAADERHAGDLLRLRGSDHPLPWGASDFQAQRLEDRNGGRSLASDPSDIGDTVQTFSDLQDEVNVLLSALRRDRPRKRRIRQRGIRPDPDRTPVDENHVGSGLSPPPAPPSSRPDPPPPRSHPHTWAPPQACHTSRPFSSTSAMPIMDAAPRSGAPSARRKRHQAGRQRRQERA